MTLFRPNPVCGGMLALALCAFSAGAMAQSLNPPATTAAKKVAAVAHKPLKITPGKRAAKLAAPLRAAAQKPVARPIAPPGRVAAAPHQPARAAASKPKLKKPAAAAAPRAARPALARQHLAPRRPVREAVPAAPAIEPVPLTPVQRDTLYRMIVHRPLQPNPVTTERVLPPTVIKPNSPPPPPAPAVAPPFAEPVPPVGAQLPPSVPLHAIPDDAVAAVPQVEPYRYAFIGDRVLLVDPTTGIVVAAINQ